MSWRYITIKSLLGPNLKPTKSRKADPEKYYNSEPTNLWFIKSYLPKEKTENVTNKEEIFKLSIDDSDGEIIEGRWYWIGKDKFLKNINKYNYKIISEDLKIDKTNVLTFFKK